MKKKLVFLITGLIVVMLSGCQILLDVFSTEYETRPQGSVYDNFGLEYYKLPNKPVNQYGNLNQIALSGSVENGYVITYLSTKKITPNGKRGLSASTLQELATYLNEGEFGIQNAMAMFPSEFFYDDDINHICILVSDAEGKHKIPVKLIYEGFVNQETPQISNKFGLKYYKLPNRPINQYSNGNLKNVSLSGNIEKGYTINYSTVEKIIENGTSGISGTSLLELLTYLNEGEFGIENALASFPSKYFYDRDINIVYIVVTDTTGYHKIPVNIIYDGFTQQVVSPISNKFGLEYYKLPKQSIKNYGNGNLLKISLSGNIKNGYTINYSTVKKIVANGRNGISGTTLAGLITYLNQGEFGIQNAFARFPIKYFYDSDINHLNIVVTDKKGEHKILVNLIYDGFTEPESPQEPNKFGLAYYALPNKYLKNYGDGNLEEVSLSGNIINGYTINYSTDKKITPNGKTGLSGTTLRGLVTYLNEGKFSMQNEKALARFPIGYFFDNDINRVFITVIDKTGEHKIPVNIIYDGFNNQATPQGPNKFGLEYYKLPNKSVRTHGNGNIKKISLSGDIKNGYTVRYSTHRLIIPNGRIGLSGLTLEGLITYLNDGQFGIQNAVALFAPESFYDINKKEIFILVTNATGEHEIPVNLIYEGIK